MANIKIDSIFIDVTNRTIEARNEYGDPIVLPASRDGSYTIRWTKVSTGGLIIQALVRMLQDRYLSGGNSV